MRVHTRAIVKGVSRTGGSCRVTDFGIEFQFDHEKAKEHPKVIEAVKKMKRFYPKVTVTFRDC